MAVKKEWLNGILSGASFPDEKKAAAAKGLKDLLKKVEPGQSIFEPANEKKAQLLKQYQGDFKASILSHGVAVEAGNQNSCNDKKQFGAAATDQQEYANKVTEVIELPSYGERKVAPKKMPKSKGISPIANVRGKQPIHPSIFKIKVGGLNTQRESVYKVETVKPRELNAKANFQAYVAAQAGFKGKAIDRSITISQDGTPMYGDDELNQATQDNLSANLANTPPTLDFPKKVEPGATVDANKINRNQPGQIQDKGNTIGNIAILGAIGVAVTAILFLIRDILGMAAFVINVASLTSTVTNIAQSFLAIFDSIGSLMGLGEGLTQPISDTFDGILNSIFGKEKVEYVKYNFARINTVFTAGANVLGKVRSTSAALASGIETDAQNTSKIGNALRRAGVVDEKLALMDEKIAVNIDKSQLKILNEKLAKVTNVSSELSGAASDIKTAKDELKTLETDRKEKEKAEKEKKSEIGKAEEAATGKPVELPNLNSGGV
jgi:hypothetical protein